MRRAAVVTVVGAPVVAATVGLVVEEVAATAGSGRS